MGGNEVSVKLKDLSKATWFASGQVRDPRSFRFCVCMLSCIQLSATPWTVARQVPLSMGVLQARILEWVPYPFYREFSWPRNPTRVSCIADGFFTIWATRETQLPSRNLQFLWSYCLLNSCPWVEVRQRPPYLRTRGPGSAIPMFSFNLPGKNPLLPTVAFVLSLPVHHIDHRFLLPSAPVTLVLLHPQASTWCTMLKVSCCPYAWHQSLSWRKAAGRKLLTGRIQGIFLVVIISCSLAPLNCLLARNLLISVREKGKKFFLFF